MNAPRDRRALLAAQTALNGIDFVEILNPAETQLRVHFLRPVPSAAALAAAITGVTIDGGETIRAVAVTPWTAASWSTISGNPALDLVVAAPGDFSTYTLTLLASAPVLDRFFDHVSFSFKANCPATMDCEPSAPVCPPDAETTPPIDYLAKDFNSFRQALSEFSALRYPEWQERAEADFGVMFMEALSSIGDDLSYQQDRIAAEAYLETATERRSVVRLARLVDYEPGVAVAARVMLQFEMAGSAGCSIPAGVLVSALDPDGATIEFETGTELADDRIYLTDPSWNALRPYWWDDSQRCLPCGTTEFWIERPAHPLADGQLVLLDTAAVTSADPPVREIVRILHALDELDALSGTSLTRIVLAPQGALAAPHDLARTTVTANLVPATHGRRYGDAFIVSPTTAPSPGQSLAIARTGANGTPQCLHTLRNAPLAWLASDDALEDPTPEIRVLETSTSQASAWTWRRRLLEADAFEQAVTIDPVRYRPIDPRLGVDDYDGADGATLRFGDGVFGALPGDDMVFDVLYRVGGGSRGNVAAGAITRLDASHPVAANILSVTNPLAAAGGRDEEPTDQVREMAPQRFRATQFRAIRAEDYDRAAMTLPWVERAGTAFRYTGSWLSVFTAADPRGSESLPVDGLVDLTNLLDRYRLAGYEAFATEPRYASIDLEVTLCSCPDAFRADVEQAVRMALDTTMHPDGTRGFFHPDRFTFGVALERSALEAALQEVPGVDGVVKVRYRRRGHTPRYVTMADSVPVARDEIVRVDNDPSRPERGSLSIQVRGGK